MKLSAVTRLKIRELNDHVTCKLCSGYLVDATTLVVCQEPHSFCRSCLWRHLESHSRCPVCQAEINRSQLQRLVRPDHTLQDLVYKLVPHLYKNELKRRRDFYFAFSQSDKLKDENKGKDNSADKASTSTAKTKETDGGNGRIQIFDRHFVELAGFICTPEEIVSLSVEYAPQTNENPNPNTHTLPPPKKRKRSKSSDTKAPPETETQQSKRGCKRKQKEGTKASNKKRKEEKNLENLTFKRYFRCPAAVTVNHLKKLLHYKLELPSNYQIELLHSGEVLHGDYTLMDIAYIFNWRRKAPMQFHFNICKFEMDESMDQMPHLTREASPPVLNMETPLSPASNDKKFQSEEVGEMFEKKEENKNEKNVNSADQASTINAKGSDKISSEKSSLSELLTKPEQTASLQRTTTTTISENTTTTTTATIKISDTAQSQAPVRKKRKPTSPSKKLKNPAIQPNSFSQPHIGTTTTLPPFLVTSSQPKVDQQPQVKMPKVDPGSVGVSAASFLVTQNQPVAPVAGPKVSKMDSNPIGMTTAPPLAVPTTSAKPPTTPSAVIGLSASQPPPLQPAYQKSVHFNLPQSAASAPPAVRPTILPTTTNPNPQIINGSFAILTSGNGNRSGNSGNCTGSPPTRTLGIVLFGEPPQVQVINGSRVCT